MAEPAAKRPAREIEPNVYFALGVVGVLILVIGIYRPALQRFPYSGYLELVVAAIGGALAIFGFSRWWDARKAERDTIPLPQSAKEKLPFATSLEVYDPRAESKPARVGPRGPSRPPSS